MSAPSQFDWARRLEDLRRDRSLSVELVADEILAAVAAERARVLAEAAAEVMTEARWQESLRVRGNSTDTRVAFIERLLTLARIFDSRALSASHGSIPTALAVCPEETT